MPHRLQGTGAKKIWFSRLTEQVHKGGETSKILPLPVYFAWNQMNLNTLILAKLTEMVSSLRQHILVFLPNSAQTIQHLPRWTPACWTFLNTDAVQLETLQWKFSRPLLQLFFTPCSPPLWSPVTSSCLWRFTLWLQKHSLSLRMRCITATCGMRNSEVWRLKDHKISNQVEHCCHTVSITAWQGSSFLTRSSEKQ